MTWQTYFDELIAYMEPDDCKRRCILNRRQTGARSRCAVFYWQLERFIKEHYPCDFTVAPSQMQCTAFVNWIRVVCKTATQKVFMREKLGMCRAHARYLEELAPSRVANDVVLFEELQLKLPNRLKFGSFQNHMQALLDVAERGQISEWQALSFCTGHGNLGATRFHLVLSCGYRYDADELKRKIEQRMAFSQARYQLFAQKDDFNAKRTPFSAYITLCDALLVTDTSSLGQLAKEEVLRRLITFSFPNASCAFKLLEHDCLLSGLDDLLRFLKQELPFAFTSLSKFDKLVLRSVWHAELLVEIVANLKKVCRTTYEKQSETVAKTQTAMILWFLIDSFRKKAQTISSSSCDALEWFFKNYDSIDIAALTKRYVETKRVQNEKVKTSIELHSAATPVGEFHHFLKYGLGSRIRYVPLDQTAFLKTLTNLRVAADPELRRTFTEEEIASMYHVARDKPDMMLVLVLLREIGLRIAAILHLRICMLIDPETKTARKMCTVPEKAQTKRQFVTSLFLRQTINVYYQQLAFESHDDYVFYPSNLTSRSKMARHLKDIAKEAHVVAKVHPHAFRHTIVGNLMQADNPIGIVSKFMGHKSIKTTERHYFVSTAMQLHESMNNPFTQTYFKKRFAETDAKLDLEMQSAKKKKLYDLICTYHNVLGSNCKADKSAQDVKKDLMETFPNWQKLLQELQD
jgi:integrase